MSNARTVKICVNGVHYSIVTSEPESYVHELAHELDGAMRAVIENNPSVSFNDVAVLCCINYIDAYKRSEEGVDRMRSQISEYLEESNKAREEAGQARTEAERSAAALEMARQEVERLKKELEAAKRGGK